MVFVRRLLGEIVPTFTSDVVIEKENRCCKHKLLGKPVNIRQ